MGYSGELQKGNIRVTSPEVIQDSRIIKCIELDPKTSVVKNRLSHLDNTLRSKRFGR